MLIILKTTPLTQKKKKKKKKNPHDLEGLLLQLFLILSNKFFLSVWFLQKQQIASVANLEFVLRTFFGLGIPHHARMNSHEKAWSCKKNKRKNIKSIKESYIHRIQRYKELINSRLNAI